MYKRGEILYNNGMYREIVYRRDGHVGKALILCQDRKSPQTKWKTRIWMIRYVKLEIWHIETFNRAIPARNFYNIQLRREK